MKNSNNHIEERIKETLSSLDHLKKASPGPFFYARLKARMEQVEEESDRAFLLVPVYQRIAVAVLIILVIANIFTALQFLGNGDNSTQPATVEEAFMEQYYPSSTTVYNIEQDITQ